ncbi:MAG: hypothetical protein EPN82_04615 [Bacteroidetes bacterium]|nr:MAG: hypothetical protein EPN82_04615 [Bacteroidota bacterium]
MKIQRLLYYVFLICILSQITICAVPLVNDSTKSKDSCLHSFNEGGYKYYSFIYSKHSPPNLLINREPYFYDGNNFFGIERGSFFKFSKSINLGYIFGLEVGNINGATSMYISFIPCIEIDRNWIKVDFGAGPSLFGVGKDYYSGGIGLSSYLGLKLNLYKNFGIQVRVGLDIYSKKTYNYLGIGFVYYF